MPVWDAHDLFRAVFEEAANPILIADDDGRYVEVNEAAARLFGLARAELLGKRAADFVDPAKVTAVQDDWNTFLGRRGQAGRFPLRRPDGQERTLQYQAVSNIRPGLHLSVLLDVTDVAKAEERRQELVAELERERELRESFVMALSHDLRAPLQAAKLVAGRLLRKAGADAAIPGMLQRLDANLDRIADMVRDLLDANRIKAGQPLALSFEPVDLCGLVHGVVDGLTQEHGTRFTVRCEAQRLEGRWNAEALRRVVENLASNALKYGEPGAPITLALEPRDHGARFAVHNHGRPIPPSEQAHVFTAFRRAGGALESGQKGWGIGLTLSRGLVEAHGGRLELERSDAQGTTFAVWLPREPP